MIKITKLFEEDHGLRELLNTTIEGMETEASVKIRKHIRHEVDFNNIKSSASECVSNY